MAVITLLTDLGLHDASAGVVKGVLLSAIPGITLVDISHEVPPFSTRQAAYLLGTSYTQFPAGSLHLVITDIFYDSAPQLVMARHQQQYILAPNNGLIPMALNGQPAEAWLCSTPGTKYSFREWLGVAASAAAAAMQGAALPYPPVQQPLVHLPMLPVNDMREVLYVDHFGNVVTDISRSSFEEQHRGRFRLHFMKVNELTNISRNYSDVTPGDSLCRFNRHGFLEICVNQGSAADLFGLKAGSRHNEIKISFE